MEDSRFARFNGLINNATKSIQRLKVMHMERFQLSAAHTNCLYRLAAAQPAGLTQGELAQREQMDRAQVCRVLRELQKNGYVQVTGVTCYKRRYRLTESGLAVAAEIENTVERITKFVVSDIPEADLAVFYRTLQTINTRLNQAAQRFAGPGKQL